MKTPKMPSPSQEELEAQRLNNILIQRQIVRLDKEEAQQKAERERMMQAVAGNRVGIRSLLSNDWQGFQRGGVAAQ